MSIENILIIFIMGAAFGIAFMGVLWMVQDRDDDWTNKTRRKYNGRWER